MAKLYLLLLVTNCMSGSQVPLVIGRRNRGDIAEALPRFIDARLIHPLSLAGCCCQNQNIKYRPLPLPMTHDRTNAGNTEMWQIQIGKSQVSSNLKIPNTNPCHSTQQNVVEIKNRNIKGLKLNLKYSLYSWCHMIRQSWPIASSYRLSVTQIHVDL